MEAAFCLTSYPSSSISLPTTKPSLLFTSNCNSINILSYSYSSSLTSTKPHFSCFRNASSPLLTINTIGGRVCRSVFHPITCAIDGRVGPRKEKDNNENDKIKSSRVMAGATMVLACTMLGIIMSSNGRSMQAKALIPGLPAKLMTASINKMDGYPFSNLFGSRSQGSDSPASKSSRTTIDIKAIEKEVADIASKGEFDKAITKLKSTLEKLKNDAKKDDEKEYFIEMMLVEMLIRQGKFKEVLDCKCLSGIDKPEDVVMSDPRIYSYKTILYLMTDDYARAKMWCKALLKNLDSSWKARKRLMSDQDDD